MSDSPGKGRAAARTLNRPSSINRSISARWTKRIAQQGFTPVATVFLVAYAQLAAAQGQRGLNSTEALLIIHIVSFKWDERDPFPRIKVLAERMGLTPRSVRNTLKCLEERGLVKRVRLPNDIANRYDMSGLFLALEAWIDGQKAVAA